MKVLGTFPSRSAAKLILDFFAGELDAHFDGLVMSEGVYVYTRKGEHRKLYLTRDKPDGLYQLCVEEVKEAV
mgnify:CR=1 FL=1